MMMITHFLNTFQDAQELGISIELLPLSRPNEEFNASHFYAVSWDSPTVLIVFCSWKFLYITSFYLQVFQSPLNRNYLGSRMMILISLCP